MFNMFDCLWSLVSHIVICRNLFTV